MRQSIGTIGWAVVAAVVFAAPAWGQVQTKEQQKCINKINKDAIKIHAAQGKSDASCVKDAVKGALGSTTPEACLTADRRGKVAKKSAKLSSDDTKFCGTAPDFAYTGVATTVAAAKDAEIGLVHDTFGDPLQTGVLNTLLICDTFPAECLCQRQVIKREGKLFRAMSKIFIKCKKAALKPGKTPFSTGAVSAAELSECITNAAHLLSVEADTKGKISKGITQLGDRITQFCDKGGLDEFGGGNCAGFSDGASASGQDLAGLRDCLAAQTKCRFCKMAETMDGMTLACNTWATVGTTVPTCDP